MKILLPLIGGSFVMWYTTEVMTEDLAASVPVPYGAEYPDLVNFLAAVLTFVVLVFLFRKRHASS